MANGVSLSISFKDTELFNDIAEILKKIFQDERISKEIRNEYMARVKELLGGGG